MRLQTRFLRALLHIYKRHKQKSANLTLAHCLATARHTIRKTPYCFLITAGQTGWASARLVEPIVELDPFVFWIGTNPTLRKIAEVNAHPQVTLAFGNTSGRT